MKKCSWCGREYPDDVSTCVVDQQSLVSVASPAPEQASGSGKAEIDEPATVQSFLVLFARYVLAMVVSYFVSYAVFFGGLYFLMWAGMVGFVLLLIASGFSGVFVGALCLPQSGRRFGSVVMLVFGLAYYIYFRDKLSENRE